METRNITVTLEKAKEWYNSGNESLKEVALQAFNKNELVYSFKNIITFKGACEALNENYNAANITARNIAVFSRASAAMFKLNIIRKALNLGQDLSLTKSSSIWYPNNQFATEDCTSYSNMIKANRMEIIGKIKNEGVLYNVFGGSASFSIFDGVGDFDSRDGAGCATSHAGFLGCASREIAEHFGKYFGMLITEAKYGDLEDFVIIKE